MGGDRVRRSDNRLGLSQSFLLTFLCLAVTGAADTVRMVLPNVIASSARPITSAGG